MNTFICIIILILLIIVFSLYCYLYFENEVNIPINPINNKFNWINLSDYQLEIDNEMENEILKYIKSRKYNFISKTNLKIENNQIEIPLKTIFTSFQVWSPLHIKYNNERKIKDISSLELAKMIKISNKQINFIPTCYIVLNGEYKFFVIEDCSYDGFSIKFKCETKQFVNTEPLKNGEYKDIVIYIDANTIQKNVVEFTPPPPPKNPPPPPPPPDNIPDNPSKVPEDP